ncbi:MAG: hypothetical protein MUC59_02475, partial [Saprospiraceae bacterium]|nr:hypothetical protein [Saprospiraceae bacterium]
MIALTFMALALFVWSCQKEEAAANGFEKGGTLKNPSCAEDQPTSATVLELMENPDDGADTRINHILYHYAQAVRQAMENPTKRCELVNAMLAAGEEGVLSLKEYATTNTSFATALNEDIKESIGENNVYPRSVETGIDALVLDANWDANAYLRDKFEYESVKYEPVVHFVGGAKPCDLSKPWVVVIGTDVNDCDDVAGWRGNTEILMGEAEAASTGEIVIFVGVGRRGGAVIHSLEQDGKKLEFAEAPVSERENLDIDVTKHQIKKRF